MLDLGGELLTLTEDIVNPTSMPSIEEAESDLGGHSSSEVAKHRFLRKGTRECSNYREITLLKVYYRVLERRFIYCRTLDSGGAV